jgi:hypothetical protein
MKVQEFCRKCARRIVFRYGESGCSGCDEVVADCECAPLEFIERPDFCLNCGRRTVPVQFGDVACGGCRLAPSKCRCLPVDYETVNSVSPDSGRAV